MGTDAEVPLAHRFERSHLLDAVRVEVLGCSPYANSTPRMNRPVETEKLCSWKAMNDTTYPLGGAARTHHREPSTRQCR
jgi:hypothetical protein